jgi:ABC-type polysaccharide/polyol phosphate export permease
MKGLAAIDPLQYGVDGMRGALIHGGVYPIYIDFIVVLAVAIGLIVVADYAFTKMQAK